MVTIGFNPYRFRNCATPHNGQCGTQMHRPSNFTAQSMSYQPKSNIKQMENGFVIEVAVPGFEKKDISIQLVENNLVVKVNKGEEHVENAKSFIANTFEKTYILPENIDRTNISASCDQGLLTITLKLAENTKKSIEII